MVVEVWARRFFLIPTTYIKDLLQAFESHINESKAGVKKNIKFSVKKCKTIVNTH
jgi:hypothetical protein